MHNSTRLYSTSFDFILFFGYYFRLRLIFFPIYLTTSNLYFWLPIFFPDWLLWSGGSAGIKCWMIYLQCRYLIYQHHREYIYNFIGILTERVLRRLGNISVKQRVRFKISYSAGMTSHELRISKEMIENKERLRQSVELVCFEHQRMERFLKRLLVAPSVYKTTSRAVPAHSVVKFRDYLYTPGPLSKLCLQLQRA